MAITLRQIIGTEGILRIASVRSAIVENFNEHGVRRECNQDFLERFDQAYVNEVQSSFRVSSMVKMLDLCL